MPNDFRGIVCAFAFATLNRATYAAATDLALQIVRHAYGRPSMLRHASQVDLDSLDEARAWLREAAAVIDPA